jgi:hypothetical protein
MQFQMNSTKSFLKIRENLDRNTHNHLKVIVALDMIRVEKFTDGIFQDLN